MANAVINQPQIKIGRSAFKGLSHSVTFTAEHGVAVPYECMEVLPGDTIEMAMRKFIKMGNPVVPIMDNIQANFDVFYVSFSQLMPKFKEFWGENPSGKGFANLDNSIKIPSTNFYPSRKMVGGNATEATSGKIGDYLGIVADKGIPGTESMPRVSKLPGLAYFKIINRWYLNRELQNPFILKSENTDLLAQRIVNGETQGYTYADYPIRVNKMADLYTRCAESAQAGEAVFLPLGDVAPVITGDDHDVKQHTVLFKTPQGNHMYENGNTYLNLTDEDKLSLTRTPDGLPVGTNQEIVPSNLWADLTQATGIEWNTLRISGALQRYKEKQISGGSLYYDWLLTHFGVKAPNLLIQEPELLSHNGMEINIAPIYQTFSQETGTEKTTLGQPGAISVSRQDDYCFTKAFVEPGLIMCIFSTRQKRTYSQGLKKFYTKLNPTDFYIPEFANIGPQAIKKKELFVSGDGTDEQTFGFNEAWAEYRNEKNRVCGEVNPANKGSNALWTLADKLTEAPIIGDEFIQEDDLEIERCLTTTGLSMPYYVQVYLDIKAIRPLPTYSIPSLTGWY